jgi:hypothetical protein
VSNNILVPKFSIQTPNCYRSTCIVFSVFFGSFLTVSVLVYFCPSVVCFVLVIVPLLSVGASDPACPDNCILLAGVPLLHVFKELG